MHAIAGFFSLGTLKLTPLKSSLSPSYGLAVACFNQQLLQHRHGSVFYFFFMKEGPPGDANKQKEGIQEEILPRAPMKESEAILTAFTNVFGMTAIHFHSLFTFQAQSLRHTYALMEDATSTTRSLLKGQQAVNGGLGSCVESNWGLMYFYVFLQRGGGSIFHIREEGLRAFFWGGGHIFACLTHVRSSSVTMTTHGATNLCRSARVMG